LAYADGEKLWLRDLPDGSPREVASAHRIAWPRIAPSGRWIAFQDGDVARLFTTAGRSTAQFTAPGGAWNAPSFRWIDGRDDLAVSQDDRLNIYSAGDKWRAPRQSIPPDLMLSAKGGYAYTSGAALFLGSSGAAAPARIAETRGFFDLAGFTRSGDWLLYWKADEAGADIETDGLDLYAVSTRVGSSHKLGLETLVYGDTIAFSPVRDVVAVTSGSGRETWADKTVALVDLTGSTPVVKVLTSVSLSSQLPAWSPDGSRLAWSASPDADVFYRQQLIQRGQETVHAIDPSGRARELPINANLRLGAPHEVAEQCVRLRRIWLAEMDNAGNAVQRFRQLTNDSQFFDEEPTWSRDGTSILFCRTDRQDARTIWLMNIDGSQQRQIAGPLRPRPNLSELEKFDYGGRYYGYTDWRRFFDWWQGPSELARELPSSGF
jgi:hypothetical protein